MMKSIAFLSVLLVVSATCWADEPEGLNRSADRVNFAPGVDNQDPVAADESTRPDDPAEDAPATDAAPPADDAPSPSDSGGIRFMTDEEAAKNGHGGLFTPVCDCDGGCHVPRPHLGCGDCNCSCGCTTDEWCQHPCLDGHGTRRLLDDGTWVSDDEFFDVLGPSTGYYNNAARFGWWGVSSSGSKTRVGEFQDLKSSPFFDVDSVMSDGVKYLDFTISGLDNEANDVFANYYGPHMQAKIRYQRYLRRWDHDPMESPGQPFPPNNPNGDIVSEDLNIGEDYAIRVQQLDTKFRGAIGENVNWKLNVWGMRKFGERQVNMVGHCYNVNAPAPGAADNRCHVLSQRQQIDWTTFEVTPGIEVRFDGVTVEYSHTIRTFGQNDQMVDRQYTRFGYSPASGTLGPDFVGAVVPENETHIDRVKMQAQLSEDNFFYGNVYTGYTNNKFRNTQREMRGLDLRFTNRSIENFNVTAYGSMYDENNELPSVFFTSAPWGVGENANNVDHPINYNRTRYGIKNDWQPFRNDELCEDCTTGWTSMRLVSGYEFYVIQRDFATYSSTRLGTFTQPTTKTHQIEFGPAWGLTQDLDGFVRYRGRFTEDPLIGVRESQGRFNTNLPEQDHRVEIGGTWMPADNFMATAQFSVVNRWNDSFYPSNAVGNLPIRFDEDDYPFILTLWHAPTERLSFTAAYAYSSNFIDQDITVGFRGPETPGSPFETAPWSYQGTNHLLSLSMTYKLTENLDWIGGVEYNNGSNAFDVPPMTDNVVIGPPVAIGGAPDWSLLPSFSAVRVSTVRLTTGLDWQPYEHVTTYARYVYFDYEDLSQGYYTGESHMFLAGAGIVW